MLLVQKFQILGKNRIFSMVTLWLLVGCLFVTRYDQAFPGTSSNKSGVLPRLVLIGHAHFSQYMEWHNLGIITLKHAICSKYFWKIK